MSLKVYAVIGKWERNPINAPKSTNDVDLSYSGLFNNYKNNRVIFFDKESAEEVATALNKKFLGERGENKLSKYKYKPVSFSAGEVELKEVDWVSPLFGSELWNAWIGEIQNLTNRAVLSINDRIGTESRKGFVETVMKRESAKYEKVKMDTKNHLIENKEMWDHHANYLSATNKKDKKLAEDERNKFHLNNLIKQLKKCRKMGSDNQIDIWHYYFATVSTNDVKLVKKYIKLVDVYFCEKCQGMLDEMKKNKEFDKKPIELYCDLQAYDEIATLSDIRKDIENAWMKKQILTGVLESRSYEKYRKKNRQ